MRTLSTTILTKAGEEPFTNATAVETESLTFNNGCTLANPANTDQVRCVSEPDKLLSRCVAPLREERICLT